MLGASYTYAPGSFLIQSHSRKNGSRSTKAYRDPNREEATAYRDPFR